MQTFIPSESAILECAKALFTDVDTVRRYCRQQPVFIKDISGLQLAAEIAAMNKAEAETQDY